MELQQAQGISSMTATVHVHIHWRIQVISQSQGCSLGMCIHLPSLAASASPDPESADHPYTIISLLTNKATCKHS